jgi:hypothetical protein
LAYSFIIRFNFLVIKKYAIANSNDIIERDVISRLDIIL